MSQAIIDTHLHIWDPAKLNYPWLADAPKIAGPHLLRDYDLATTGLDIQKMFFVQCEVDPEQYLDEVKWVSEVAEQDQRIQGIIGLATGKLSDLVDACYGKNSLRL